MIDSKTTFAIVITRSTSWLDSVRAATLEAGLKVLPQHLIVE